MIDLITTEQALRLRELGAEWHPGYGDYYAVTRVPEAPDAHVLGSPILVKSEVQIEWLQNHQDEVVWLLRLDQILAKIRAAGYVYVWLGINSLGQHFCHAMGSIERPVVLAVLAGFGPNDTQAAADCLIKIKEAK